MLESTRDDGFQPFGLLAVALVAVPTRVTAVWLVRSAGMLVAAVPDLFVRREVDGVVLTRRNPAGRRPALSYPERRTQPGPRQWRLF